jgi:dimethylglycine dehydrogenase
MTAKKVGRLTSGGYSVAFGKQIGMGYVRPELAKPGHEAEGEDATEGMGCRRDRGQPLRSLERIRVDG